MTSAYTFGPRCPQCGSTHISCKTIGRVSGTVLGGTAGAASGWASASTGASAGAALASRISRSPPVIVSGALIGALLGFVGGAELGYRFGRFLDEKKFREHRCLKCGADFTL